MVVAASTASTSSLVSPPAGAARRIATAILARRPLTGGRSTRSLRKRRLAINPPRRALCNLVGAFRAYQPRTEAEERARQIASDRMLWPLQDPDADERRCLTALRSLVAVYVATWTESDRLTNAEAEAIFTAQGFLDRFDESQNESQSQSQSVGSLVGGEAGKR